MPTNEATKMETEIYDSHEKLAFRKILWSNLTMNESILVVDDEEAILKGINLNLGRKFDITLAHGSDEALKQLEEKGEFAVVVSDMRMPGMDGATLLRKVRESYPETLCILLTGHADFEFGGSEALQSGMLHKILNKPCSPEKLRSTIQGALNLRAGRKEEPEEQLPPGAF
ncbi:MAG: hypothetical protein CMI22_00445 [Opitutae bacterium]|nr:hypothetical protein [Opitutae bacterium]